ncbi:hypothetical protein [Pseudofrankia sp. DC12]|nr:hypothetical protein [Pseudofrankia sp. DC12]
MAKLISSTICSLDGYVEDEENEPSRGAAEPDHSVRKSERS